jgi:hypothetical protein
VTERQQKAARVRERLARLLPGAAVLLTTLAATAAFEPKFPRLVGD